MSKTRIGVIFGGKSGEHEVSLVSARSIMDAIDKEKYEVVPIGIMRDGRWITQDDPLALLSAAAQQSLSLSGEEPELPASVRRELLDGFGMLGAGVPAVDVVFPVVHGPYGEDGTLQGLLEMAGIPYVGGGVAASAVGMDKVLMKDVFRQHGLPVVDSMPLLRRTWQADPTGVEDEIERRIGFPCFVKPANLGSSVGISKVVDRAGLGSAIRSAAVYDRKLIIEHGVTAREIECSVLGNDEPQASLPGEIVPAAEFYDYAAKYADDRTRLIIPAQLSPEVVDEVRRLAVETFKSIDCAGMARVDFLLSIDDGRLYVSEINTIPGFTSVSMYAKLWEASGLSYPDLIDRLIGLAFERFSEKMALNG
ncbi:MAG: D-alanine--D-alanine ligase [Chloroflexota bacterium]|nr:MAG: D-alanine--D-alanine ligase [Chloroflexota bacterium]